MDALDLADGRYNQVLTDLSRVNRVTMAARPTIAFLHKIMRIRGGDAKPLRLLDVGFGHGDMLRTIAQTAEKNGWPVVLVGIDLNPRSAEIAREATPSRYDIQWLTGDYQVANARRNRPELGCHHFQPGGPSYDSGTTLRISELHGK